jgi:hypothetical protein
MSINHSNLTDTIAAALSSLRERGWEYPIYALTAATNGHIQAFEFVADEARILASYEPHNYARLPIHIIFVDSSGLSQPALLTLNPPQSQTPIAIQ